MINTTKLLIQGNFIKQHKDLVQYHIGYTVKVDITFNKRREYVKIRYFIFVCSITYLLYKTLQYLKLSNI